MARFVLLAFVFAGGLLAADVALSVIAWLLVAMAVARFDGFRSGYARGFNRAGALLIADGPQNAQPSVPDHSEPAGETRSVLTALAVVGVLSVTMSGWHRVYNLSTDLARAQARLAKCEQRQPLPSHLLSMTADWTPKRTVPIGYSFFAKNDTREVSFLGPPI